MNAASMIRCIFHLCKQRVYEDKNDDIDEDSLMFNRMKSALGGFERKVFQANLIEYIISHHILVVQQLWRKRRRIK